eukprot:UN12670
MYLPAGIYFVGIEPYSVNSLSSGAGIEINVFTTSSNFNVNGDTYAFQDYYQRYYKVLTNNPSYLFELIAVLAILNFICVAKYFYNKNKLARVVYKKVSMDSTDEESKV